MRAEAEKNEIKEDMFRQATRFHVEKALTTETDSLKYWRTAGYCLLKAREATRERRLEEAKNERKRRNEESEQNKRSKIEWFIFSWWLNHFILFFVMRFKCPFAWNKLNYQPNLMTKICIYFLLLTEFFKSIALHFILSLFMFRCNGRCYLNKINCEWSSWLMFIIESSGRQNHFSLLKIAIERKYKFAAIRTALVHSSAIVWSE